MRKLVFGFAWLLTRLPSRGERGGVAVLVAVLLGGGVLLGVGVLVIDVGRLYLERAELQNGADAAALAVAKSCADGACNTGLAVRYADGNASALTGHTAGVSLICGSRPLGSCPAATGTITDCPPPKAGGAGYVDVHAATRLPGGSTLLPSIFAASLPGLQGYKGSTVHACAEAGWGPPSAATTTAFTISACSWDQATSRGTSIAPAPPAIPPPSYDRVIYLHGSTVTSKGCSSEPSGADGPGNFGWTADSGNCSISITGRTFGGNTGVSASQACETRLAALQQSRQVALIPVYVQISGHGSNATYTLKGFAAFVVTGYYLPGFTAQDWLNPRNTCKGSSKCITGYFTQALIPKATGAFGGPDLGATILKLTG